MKFNAKRKGAAAGGPLKQLKRGGKAEGSINRTSSNRFGQKRRAEFDGGGEEKFQQKRQRQDGRGGGKGKGRDEGRKKRRENPNLIPLRKRTTRDDDEDLEVADAKNYLHNFLETRNYEGEDSEDGEGEGEGGGQKKRKEVGGFKKKSGGFQSMGLSPLVLKGVLRRGYQVPTPIQRKSIPIILKGGDVVAMARTGSGKTAAFLIPLFEKLHVNRTEIGKMTKYPRALILSPTRELALQTVKFFREIGRFVNLKVAAILGGDSMESQFRVLHDKPDVVIATPGRFMHLCVEMEMKLDGVEYIVYDEADRLFEMGFGEQISEIVRRLPESRQTVLFSATLPKLLVEFTKAGLHDPSLIRLDVDTKLSEMLKLTYLACRSEDKMAVLCHLIKHLVDQQGQTIVFAATKHHVEFIHQLLEEQEISSCYIYSSLDPSARKIAIAKFRSGRCNVMIVTDIAARGIDIPVLDNVINFHFPAKPKLFMHRVGRVARAGRSGVAYSIVSPDEVAFLLDLHLFLNKPLKLDGDGLSSSYCEDESVVVGRIPQDIINQESGIISSLVQVKTELETLMKVCRNGYSQYLKSRPSASTESNRRAKDIDVSKLKVHPIFSDHVKDDPMDSFVSQIHNYRPHSTIFEIGPKSNSETHKVMKIKRTQDQRVVDKHRMVKSSLKSEETGKRHRIVKKDVENFIPYLAKDHLTETGLAVGSTFDKQIEESTMDITGDDSDMLKSQRSVMKWDQKRKKFVSTGKDTKMKKIRTESGAWISASYKTDRYKAWKERSKTDQQSERAEDIDDSDGDDFSEKGSNLAFRGAAFSSKLVKTGKNERPGGTAGRAGRFKTELKRSEEILKNRKVKEKKKLNNQSKTTKRKNKRGGASGNKSFRKKK